MKQSLFTKDKPQIVTSNRILYTASLFARSSLLHLQEIGELTALAPHISKRSGLSSYLFISVVHGSGCLTYDGKEYVMRPGDCAFIDCRHPYSHKTDEKLWTLHWCHFYGPSLSLIYEKYMERGGRPVFKPANPEHFQECWESIFAIAGSSDYIRDMRINEGLSSLLTLLMNESWDPGERSKASTKRQSLMAVKEYLDTHYTQRITLEQLSHDFYISKYYLIHIFKEQFGMSVTAYLQNVRITHAKRLLRFTDKSVEEVGLSCGIGELNYFSRVFKEVEGVSPSVYREQW